MFSCKVIGLYFACKNCKVSSLSVKIFTSKSTHARRESNGTYVVSRLIKKLQLLIVKCCKLYMKGEGRIVVVQKKEKFNKSSGIISVLVKQMRNKIESILKSSVTRMYNWKLFLLLQARHKDITQESKLSVFTCLKCLREIKRKSIESGSLCAGQTNDSENCNEFKEGGGAAA